MRHDGGQLGQLAKLQQVGQSWMNIKSILNIVLIVGCRWWWCCVVIDRPGGGRGSWWAPKWAPGSSNGQGLPPMEILCFFSVTLLEAFARTGYTYQPRTFNWYLTIRNGNPLFLFSHTCSHCIAVTANTQPPIATGGDLLEAFVRTGYTILTKNFLLF